MSSHLLLSPKAAAESLGVGLLACLPLYGTRGFVYKTFCVASQGNEEGGIV